MFDFPALDVAVGLMFLYLVLALACSAVNEWVTTALGMRARFLQLGLLNLLSAAPNPTVEGRAALQKFYGHPLVQTHVRPNRGRDLSGDPTEPQRWWRKPPYPSYLPARTFVATLTDLARDTTEWREEAESERGRAQAAAAVERMKGAADDLERSIASIPNTRLAEALLAVHRSVEGDATKFHRAAEQWFDDSMERVSGWYKRRVQLFLFVIAAATVVALNADSLSVGRVLWRDDAVRAAVVKQAEAVDRSGLEEGALDTTIEKLDLPLGWELSRGDRPTQIPENLLGVLAKLLGLALTIGAVMLGAQFWFDLLSKVMRVRSTGAPPPASDAVRKGEGEQARAGAGATTT